MLRKSKPLIAVALTLMLSLTGISGTVAFANEMNSEGALVTQNEQYPVQAAINKTLRLPRGTTTPDVEFNFLAKRVSVDGISVIDIDDEAELEAKIPSLKNLSVSYTTSDSELHDQTTNTISIIKETGDIFAGVTFPHAGIYVYEISEIEDTNSAIDNNAPHEVLTYSKAMYTLTVYVANTADGSGTYVKGLGTRVMLDDDGDAASGNKVDPTPGGNGVEYNFSQMVFVNDFVRTNGAVDQDNPDPVNESTLFVENAVTGDFASREQYFEFVIDIMVPSIVKDVPEYYRAYIVENGVVINPVNNADASLIGSDAGGSYIKVYPDRSTEFSLKHGQKLVFVNTPVGTGYVVEEKAAMNYLPSYIITTNSIAGANVTGTLSTGLTTDTEFVAELLNAANFTNNRESVTPTGLNLHDLPFIGLIALAAGSLILFVVVKSRRRTFVTE